MKKFGFTLAEVLIALGIVGVVSALTLPSLINTAQEAQIGPKVGKAAAMMEQANQSLLDEYDTDKLSDTGLWVSNGSVNDVARYANELSRYLKISQYEGNGYALSEADLIYNGSNGANVAIVNINNQGRSWISKDGMIYHIVFSQRNFIPVLTPIPHKTRIGYILVDINGESGPNLAGTDIFEFTLMDDGSLNPAGSRDWNGGPSFGTPDQWRAFCPNDRQPTTGRYFTCTASIFENNMKVRYKLR